MAIDYFFSEEDKCDLCETKKLTISMDNSLGEYNSERLCLDCITNIFDTKKDGEIRILPMRN